MRATSRSRGDQPADWAPFRVRLGPAPPAAAGGRLQPWCNHDERGGRVARLKIAYVGGGSTRAAGTMASFIEQGENFVGSEVVLIDLDGDRLGLIRELATRMAAARGLELTVSATTDRRAGLDACDAVLTSYRPGGF